MDTVVSFGGLSLESYGFFLTLGNWYDSEGLTERLKIPY